MGLGGAAVAPGTAPHLSRPSIAFVLCPLLTTPPHTTRPRLHLPPPQQHLINGAPLLEGGKKEEEREILIGKFWACVAGGGSPLASGGGCICGELGGFYLLSLPRQHLVVNRQLPKEGGRN